MKRIVLYAASFFLMVITLTACESLFQNCKLCKQVTYDDGDIINQTSETEYCGTDLAVILATPPVVIGSLTTQWECR